MTEKEKEKAYDKKIREAILNGLIDCRDAPDLGWSNFGGIHIDDCIDWLEKQGEQNPCMIQWKGDNLKEVIGFTGKDKNFGKWFKSFEEYEKYVHEHNDIFKLFNENGNHYEIPVGAWIVKTPNGYNIASNAVLKQKSANKIEPRFKVGDWVVFITNKSVYQVEKKENYEYNLRNIFGGSLCLSFSKEELIREWTIQDARDGDVLFFYSEYKSHKMTQVGIIEKYVGKHGGCSNTFKIYVGVNWDNNLQIGKYMGCSNIHPATKEQRNALMKAMNDAGCEWDAEKKELKKKCKSSVIMTLQEKYKRKLRSMRNLLLCSLKVQSSHLKIMDKC